MNIQLILGDCREKLTELADDSVDSVCCDPPYELGFMGKKWDRTGIAYDSKVWTECLRVLKPGGHLLAFGGTRTYHRLASAIEDAGFEIRDCILWIYGTGFPKSHDVSKAIDKKLGAERQVLSTRKLTGKARVLSGANYNGSYEDCSDAPRAYKETYELTAPATDEAKKWHGWGTALKPACEPIVLARKPIKGTVADNVLTHGTGALNIDDCRVGIEARFNPPAGNKPGGNSLKMSQVGMPQDAKGKPASGRWPANVIHDDSDEVLDEFAKYGEKPSPRTPIKRNERNPDNLYGAFPNHQNTVGHAYGDTGTAARFFYCSKASKKDRGAGNNHATVKPFDLMRYLVRLVTPPGGTVLDPFMGSGSTGKACASEGFAFIGIERDTSYFEIAKQRVDSAYALAV